VPRIAPPDPGSYPPPYQPYVALAGEDAFAAMVEQAGTTPHLLRGLSELQGAHRYAPGKWSVREVLGHLADTERVFAYRALRFARADATGLPGFDENAWVPAGCFEERSVASLALELASVRAASLSLFAHLPGAALDRGGPANGRAITVRALAHCIVGHERHHLAILRERYGIG
jgi:hypothetical protein